jgi:hypothetical protein
VEAEKNPRKEKHMKTKTAKPKKESKDRQPRKSAKEVYAERKKAGMCVDCGTRKAKADRVQCQTCIDATAARAAKRAKAAKK